MPKLRLAPSFTGDPLWIVGERKAPHPIDVDELELSDELADRIEAWCDVFDAAHPPTATGIETPAPTFPSPEEEAAWRSAGERIAAALRHELGDDWQVEAAF